MSPEASKHSVSTSRCAVIAEVAQAHDGSLGFAHAFIDAAASAGADAIKFQTHIAASESTPAEPWRIRFSKQDESRYDYWKRMEFTEDQWRGLRQHALDRGLQFLSSAFSIDAVEMLTRVGVHAWKVASGEVGNTQLLDAMLANRIPVYLSSGMSSLEELDSAVDRVKRAGAELVVLQCTSSYPSPPEKIGLNLIPFFAERYRVPVGLSDHSGTIYPGLAASMLGIKVLEVHLTLSREMFGPDTTSSVTTTELRQLVDGVRFIETMRSSPVDKDAIAKELAPLRGMFTRSIVVKKALPAGTELRHELLALKKPGTGLPASALPGVIGRRLRRALAADALLKLDDLESS
jgi:N,N'-diacetyllegionaminate synthase